MHVVEPKAIIVAETALNPIGLAEYLNEVGAKDWKLPTGTSDGEALVEVAGRGCYKSFDLELNKNLSKIRTDHHDYIGNILKTKHGSVLEHAHVTVGFVGVSRIFTHELVRHRAGCAYSQESMRFVRLEDVGMYIPDCIREDENALQEFKSAVNHAELAYAALTSYLIVSKPDMPFSKKKEITSAIRRIAPSGHSTNIMVTANHRAWRHLFELRTAPGVEEEIGVVMSGLAEQFEQKYPHFYQDMTLKFVYGQKWATADFQHSKI